MKATVFGLAGKGCGTVVWHGERLRRVIAAPVAAVAVAMMIPYIIYAVVDRNAEVERRASECAEIAAQAIEYAWSFVGENASAGDIPPLIREAVGSGPLADCTVVFQLNGSNLSEAESWATSVPVGGATKVVEMPDGTFAYALARHVGERGQAHGEGALIVAVPFAKYQGVAASYIVTDIVFLLVLIATIIGALWVPVTKYVTRPVEKLDAAASRIAQGNLDLRVDRREIDARGELGSLTDSFNSMVKSVAAAQGEVESRVVERTAELTEANAQLAARASQIERLNGKLSEQNRYKSEFLAIVSHELKTPITALLTNVDNVREERDDVARRDMCDQMERSLEDLRQQILMILDAAKVESGSIAPQICAVDINDVIGEAELMLGMIARGKGVACTVRVAEMPVLMTDPDMVYKIGVNLVGNAIKFTPAEGHVTVDVKWFSQDEVLSIEVTDTGVGLGTDDPECLFERFRQGDSSLGRSYGGTGLGLSLSRDFARMLGGDVEAFALERGSRFVACVRAIPWREECDDD